METILRSIRFASDLCVALGEPAYVVVAEVTESSAAKAFGCWVGAPAQTPKSRASHVAWGKMGELVLLGAGSDGKLLMTPTEGNELGYGWMGAVATRGFVVAVSKWAQEHDRLLALLTLYNEKERPLLLHHVGFRFASQVDFDIANAQHGGGMERNIPGDHERTYFPTRGYYREHQWFPEGPHDEARHWDFVVEDPKGFLNFIATAYGQVPVFFEDVGENDPMGVVWIRSESSGSLLGVMARRKFRIVES